MEEKMTIQEAREARKQGKNKCATCGKELFLTELMILGFACRDHATKEDLEKLEKKLEEV